MMKALLSLLQDKVAKFNLAKQEIVLLKGRCVAWPRTTQRRGAKRMKARCCTAGPALWNRGREAKYVL